jgi:hypothetical protein
MAKVTRLELVVVLTKEGIDGGASVKIHARRRPSSNRARRRCEGEGVGVLHGE